VTTALHRAGARGGGITLIGQAIRMAVQLASVAILSRLLSPHDFGLIAMVTVFMTLADLLRDFGMPSAALQAKELSHQQASNMFWASTALGALSCGILVACTPLIVMLYDEPRLGRVVPALALTTLISGVQAQIQVQLARGLRFTILAVSSVLAPTVGLVVAIIAALNGLGYWALVLQILAGPLTLLAIQSTSARWRPTRPRRGHGSRELFVSGAQLGVAYFLTWAASNVDSLSLGARWGATALGFYNRGWQVTVSPIGSFLSPLTQVALPMLNKAERQGRHSFDILLHLQVLVAAPASVVLISLALTAPSLVPLVLGSQWEPTVPIVQILAIGECIHALSYVSYWGFLAQRMSKQLLYYNLTTKPVGVVFILIGAGFGAEGVAWGYVAGLAVSWPINLIWLSRSAGLPALKFLGNGVRVLLSAGIVLIALQMILGQWIASQSWRAIAVGLVCSVAGFVLVLAATPTGRADIARILRIARSIR